jgi:hypothetical protein
MTKVRVSAKTGAPVSKKPTKTLKQATLASAGSYTTRRKITLPKVKFLEPKD